MYGQPMSESEVKAQYPQKVMRMLKKYRTEGIKAGGKIEGWIKELHTELPERTLTENDDFWSELKDRESLPSYVSPSQLMRLISILRPDYSYDGTILKRNQ